jgi:uncharacterized membrane protein YhhN
MTLVLGLTVLVSVLGLLRAEQQHLPGARLFKMVASTGFIAVAVAAGALDTWYGRLVLLALGLSWVGDLALSIAGRQWFLLGLIAFLLGHIAYVAAFVERSIDWWVFLAAGLVVMVVAGIVWRWLRPHLERDMVGPVAAYVIVISAMVAAAFGTAGSNYNALIPVGAVAFFASDLAVARDRFVASGFANRAWGLPLYYFGQVLLALSVAN